MILWILYAKKYKDWFILHLSFIEENLTDIFETRGSKCYVLSMIEEF